MLNFFTSRSLELCLFAWCLLGSSRANSQWVQNNGPYGAYVTAFTAIGANLFVGTNGGGVFLSTNNGSSWTSVNSGLNNNSHVACFATSGDNLFVGTYDGGVLLSTNMGASWT